MHKINQYTWESSRSIDKNRKHTLNIVLAYKYTRKKNNPFISR